MIPPRHTSTIQLGGQGVDTINANQASGKGDAPCAPGYWR